MNNIEIAWVEYGNRNDPVLLLSHGTGFHSRCWDQVVKYLEGFFVISMDHRGHGRSENCPPYSWEQLGIDLTSFIVARDLTDIRGVGHSLGGHCMVQAAANTPERFRRLTLFDPVIFEPSMYVDVCTDTASDHPVAKRRNTWESPKQMIDRLKDRAPFSRWQEDVLRDYCQHGLVKAVTHYELACPPTVETAIYASATAANVHGLIPFVRSEVIVIRAQVRGADTAILDFSASPTWPALADQFALGRDKFFPDYSHFMPMENPALAASIISANEK